MKTYLTYEAFGAVGDGIHDDMPAIIKTHAKANELGVAVKATPGACYYISPQKATAIIETDTEWTGARFIIDDRNCEDLYSAVFDVVSKAPSVSLEIQQLYRGQMEIENPYDQELLVTVENENHRDYIRWGLNQNNGVARRDNFILGADGRLTSPVAFDFDQVTWVQARPVEKTTLHLIGGEFTTIANPMNCTFTPYTATARNIRIGRSNVEVSGLTHYVQGESTFGTAYSGFIFIVDCAHVRVHDCLFTAHYIYWCTGSADKPVAMGSYDILCNNAVDVSFKHCRQTTDIEDTRYWGLFSSNFCRELMLEDCMFSRFDTHMGVTNCIIRNCTFGHQSIRIIGNGEFLIEDTRVVAKSFVQLRPDYGSTFRGNLIVRNCNWHPTEQSRALIEANNAGFHYFGYPCYLCENISIDGFMIESRNQTELPSIFGDYVGKTDEVCNYPPIVPQKVTVRRLAVADGIRLCSNPELMRETVFEIL